MATKNPDAYNADLAVSYHTIGEQLSSLKRHDEALQSKMAAVEIRTLLAKNDPASYNICLADSLDSLRFTFGQMRDFDEAVRVADRAVKVWRELAADGSSHVLSLAKSLNGLACWLGKSKKYPDALKKINECLDLHRSVLKSPSASGGEKSCHYGNALATYSDILENIGRLRDAHVAMEEGIRVLEKNKDYSPQICPNGLGLLYAQAERLKGY